MFFVFRIIFGRTCYGTMVGEGGGDWEGIFKFGLEVRRRALKTRQGDFETTSGETKEDKDGVVEAKT